MVKDYTYYKPEFDEIIRRFEGFYDAVSEGKTGNFIFRGLLDSDIAIYNNLKLDSYDFESDKGMEKYIQDLAVETEKVYDARRGLIDDILPNVALILGIGDYSAFVDGDIVFSPDTSWSQPVLENLKDWESLKDMEKPKWYGKFLDLTERALKIAQPAGIPYMRGFFSPLDLAHALRGGEIYMDFYDDPNTTHDFLDFCADKTIEFAEDIKNLVYKYLGDSKYGTWFFDGYINMSEDIACMISADLYREFGSPHTQKVIDHFGRGLLHCHSRALYIVPELCRLKNVKNIWIASDPNQPRPIDLLKELINQASNVCLSIDVDSFEDISKNIDVAKEGNIAFCIPVSSVEEGNRITDFIRSHSKI